MPPGAPSGLLLPAWEHWLRLFYYPTETLYHYTSVEALLNILATKTMWATDLQHTNDPMDLRHGENVISAALDAIITESDNQLLRTWLDEFKHTTRRQIERNDWYSVSFCTDGDLGNQWKAYGCDGKGYAMGWKATSPFPGDPFRIGITYDEALQVSVTQQIIRRHAQEVGFLSDPPTSSEVRRLKDMTGSLGVFLSMSLYSFKRASFSQETEFRWVYPALDHQPEGGAKRQTRWTNRGHIAYIEVDFSQADLIDVICGSATTTSEQRAVRDALDARGFRSTELKASGAAT
jgi:hypothetical protein